MLLVENNLYIYIDYVLLLQIRKLEFLLVDVLYIKCKYVIICGGIQFNYCRIIVFVVRELGLILYLVFRGDVQVLDMGREKDKKYNVKNIVKYVFNEVIWRNDFVLYYV